MPTRGGALILLMFIDSLVWEATQIVATSGLMSQVDVAPAYVPWLWSFESLVVVIGSLFISNFIDNVRRRRLALSTFAAFGMMYAAFYLLYPKAGLVYYSLLLLVNNQQWLVCPVLIWTLAGDVLSVAGAKRFIPILAAAAMVGSLCGNALAALVAKAPGLRHIDALLPCAVLLMVITAITAGLRDGTAAQPRRRGMESLREGFRFIADIPSFRGLAITRVLIGIAVAVFEYHMLASASHAYPSAETLQVFYATLEMAVTALVLLLVWAGVRRMSARLEFDVLFAVMPAALIGGLLSSLVWSSVGSAVVGYGLMRVTQRAIDDPARKVFNSAVSEAMRGRMNALLDGCYPLGWTFGAAVVGLVLLGTERGALAAELGPGLYLGAAVGCAGAALWLILRSRASYREAGVAMLQAPP